MDKKDIAYLVNILFKLPGILILVMCMRIRICIMKMIVLTFCFLFGISPAFAAEIYSFVSSEHPFYKLEQDTNAQMIDYKNFSLYTVKEGDSEEVCYKKMLITRSATASSLDKNILDMMNKNVVLVKKMYPYSVPNIAVMTSLGSLVNETNNNYAAFYRIMRLLPYLQEMENVPLIPRVISYDLHNISGNKNYYNWIFESLGDGNCEKGGEELKNLEFYWQSLINPKYSPLPEKDIALAKSKMNYENKERAIRSWAKMIKLYEKKMAVNYVQEKENEMLTYRNKLMQEEKEKRKKEEVILFDNALKDLSILENPPISMLKLRKAFNVLSTSVCRSKLKDYPHIPNYDTLKKIYKDGIEVVVADIAFKIYVQQRYAEAYKMIMGITEKDIRIIYLEIDCLKYMKKPVDDFISTVDKALTIEPNNADFKIMKIRLDEEKVRMSKEKELQKD